MSRMNLEELRNMKLVDSEFYVPNSKTAIYLEKRGYKTVGQLMDAIDNKELIHAKVHRLSVEAFLQAVKYRYLGEPLLYDAYLDNKMCIDDYSGGPGTWFCLETNKGRTLIDTYRIFGFSKEMSDRLYSKYYYEILKKIKAQKQEGLPVIMPRLIDFFKWVVTESDYIKEVRSNSPFIEYINTYLQAYKGNSNENSNNAYILEAYERELERLVKQYDAVADKITKLKTEIRRIKNEESSGEKQR